jgi:hypothetical protein
MGEYPAWKASGAAQLLAAEKKKQFIRGTR